MPKHPPAGQPGKPHPQPPAAGDGLQAQGHNHGGYEQAFTRQLVAALREPGKQPPAAKLQGSTFNHNFLNVVLMYATDAPGGRQALLDFLAYQEHNGHCTMPGRNEVNSSSHMAWILFAAGGGWLLALRQQDQAVLAAIRHWWRAELALEALGAGPHGELDDVELPCARDRHYPADSADQRHQREVCRGLILGRKTRVPKTAGSPESGPTSTDMACVWAITVIQQEYDKEFATQMSGIGDADLPVLRDPMQAVYADSGESVVWFDAMTDVGDPCWWVHRRQGGIDYGYVPGVKSSPGGPSPTPAPSVSGREIRRVVVKGAGK